MQPFLDQRRPPRLADFDEQMWPHYVLLLGLVGAVGLSITTAAIEQGGFGNPFRDPLPLCNAWIHYGCLGAAAWAWLTFTAMVAPRRENRRMLLAGLLTMCVFYALSLALGVAPPPTPDVDFAAAAGVAAVMLAPLLAHRLAGRYPGVHAALVFLGAAVGGGFAWPDLRSADAFGGAVAGALAAHLCGGLVLGLFGALAAARDDEAAYSTGIPKPLSSVLRVAGAAVLAVVMYESYWFINARAVTAAGEIGRRICLAAEDHKATAASPAVQDELQRRRHIVAICNARPLRWLVREDIAAWSDKSLAAIDQPHRLRGRWAETGREIRDVSRRQFDACLNRPLLLRRVLISMLAAEETSDG